MNIKILGTGCPNCKKLEASVRQVLEELKIEANVEKITDIAEIMNYGVMSLPALVIDGEVKLSGRIPDEEELKNLFSK
ncbi:MAG: thioredoxin family protein [Candidatus Moraniibacteriota bacterium]